MKPVSRSSALWIVALLCGLGACTGEEEASQSPSPTRSSPAPSPTAAPSTMSERIRAVLRDPAPAVDEVVALSGSPMAWTRAGDRLLIQYGIGDAEFWPIDSKLGVVQIFDRQGRVRAEWVEGVGVEAAREYWPVGRGLVGIRPRFSKGPVSPVLVRGDTIMRLTEERGFRAVRSGDVRFGRGWLLDEAEGTVARERRAGCRQDTIVTGADGRTWCLDPAKRRVQWTRDGVMWESYALSTSYFDYCDGGSFGADIAILGDVVAVGMFRADFSFDAGATWNDVELPTRLVNVDPDPDSLGDNCPHVEPLPDGRLVLRYVPVAVATDRSNTTFRLVKPPPRTFIRWGLDEGVMVALQRRPSATRFASYDGGETWQPLRARSLVQHLLTGN